MTQRSPARQTPAPRTAAPTTQGPRRRTASRSSPVKPALAPTTLTISSRNYSSWSLRGYLIAHFAGLAFTEVIVPTGDDGARQELLLLSPSIRVPCLTHDGIPIWDTLAIAEYLNEILPGGGLLPADRAARAHCRAICGEMHSGFASLRSALPMNLKIHLPNHRVWARAQGDIERVLEIWTECLTRYRGPFLFGPHRTLADAMYAPVVTRFQTYDIRLEPLLAGYCERILAMPEMQRWIEAARQEPEEIDELDMEF